MHTKCVALPCTSFILCCCTYSFFYNISSFQIVCNSVCNSCAMSCLNLCLTHTFSLWLLFHVLYTPYSTYTEHFFDCNFHWYCGFFLLLLLCHLFEYKNNTRVVHFCTTSYVHLHTTFLPYAVCYIHTTFPPYAVCSLHVIARAYACCCTVLFL